MKKFLSMALSAVMLLSAYALPVHAANNDEKPTETVSYTYSAGNAKTYTREMEKLGRGLIAIRTSDGVYLSWRLLDSEDAVFGSSEKNVSFNIYRGDQKIDTVATKTNYTDKVFGSRYSVAPVIDGVEGEKCTDVSVTDNSYFDIDLSQHKPSPASLPSYRTVSKWNYFTDSNGDILYKKDSNGEYILDNKGNKIAVSWRDENVAYRDVEYTIGDCSCGDIDNDGEYEIIIKWDCGAQDNSFNGVTGNVLLDAYKMDGTFLWRIDLGKNIRAGAHYTQFLVYDFDGDGKAEITCKTAPGSKDGIGQYVTKASHIENIKSASDEINNTDYRDDGGYILNGDEFFTIFNGQTGEAIDTIYYPNQRLNADVWGDTYGGRVDRFTADVAYMDGVKPYAVYMRGYYMRQNGRNSERQAACAVSFDGSQLSCDYSFDTYDVNSYSYKANSDSYDTNGNYKGVNGYREKNEIYVGQGNHNCTVADVDNDRKDEVITGALCYELDNNILKPKWCTFMEHGDALHIGDYDPTHKGLEFFTVHEDAGPNTQSDKVVEINFGMSVIDAETGKIIKHWTAAKDTGRGMMANVGAGGYYQVNAGNQVTAHIANGGSDFTDMKSTPFSNNFRIFWDGDLYDELLDGTNITSWNGRWMNSVFNSAEYGCVSINGTKSNPALQADLFGDWREEIIYPTTDNNALRVFTTAIPTEYKMKTLMHDPVYRSGVAAEQTAYNQPPHIGFYMDEEILKGGVTEISITSPSKDKYKIGENLDLSDCTVTALYANGTSETVDIKGCQITGHNPYKDGKQTITVTYHDKTVSFEIEVLSAFTINRYGFITGYYGSDESVMIPEYVDGIPVKGIDDNIFADTPVKDVYIYNDIKIDDGTFPGGITVHCFENSLVHECAETYNIPYELISADKVYADVTFDEDEYSSSLILLQYSSEEGAINNKSIPPITYYARGKNNGETSFIMKSNTDNPYLQINIGRFTTSNREPYITFDNIPDLSKVNQYELSMDFLIEYNKKGLSILLKDEDNKTISTCSASSDKLLYDKWYHYYLEYKDGIYTQTITDSIDNKIIQCDILDYNENKAVKYIYFPVNTETTGSNYIYLDNISLTAPLLSTLTINVTDNEGTPVSNADITIDNNYKASTNEKGQAVITLPTGRYVIDVTAEDVGFALENLAVYAETQVKDITLNGTVNSQDYKILSVEENTVKVNTPETDNIIIYAAKYNNNILEKIEMLIPTQQYKNTFSDLPFTPDRVFMWTKDMTPKDIWPSEQ